jgi:hypothetical protein
VHLLPLVTLESIGGAQSQYHLDLANILENSCRRPCRNKRECIDLLKAWESIAKERKLAADASVATIILVVPFSSTLQAPSMELSDSQTWERHRRSTEQAKALVLGYSWSSVKSFMGCRQMTQDMHEKCRATSIARRVGAKKESEEREGAAPQSEKKKAQRRQYTNLAKARWQKQATVNATRKTRDT